MQLRLSSDSQFFVGLTTRKYSEDRFYGVKNSSLDKRIFDPLNLIYQAFNEGKNLQPNEVTVGFTVKNKVFGRLYGPAVYKEVKDDVPYLVIKWGNEVLPLKITPQGTILPEFPAKWVEFQDETGDDDKILEFSAVFADDNPNGYPAICINVEIGIVNPETSKLIDNHTLSLPIKFAEFDKNSKLTAAELKKKFRSDALRTFELIAAINENSNFIKLEELALGRIEVVGLTKFASKKTPGEYHIAIKLVDGTQIWCPRSLTQHLLHEPDDSNGWLAITENDPETKNVKGTLQIGKNTVPFAQDPPPKHCQLLGIGSHEIIGYYMPPNNQYGSIVAITPDGDRYYVPKGGNAFDALKASPIIDKNNPAILEITSIREDKGKYYVEASLILSFEDEELDFV